MDLALALGLTLLAGLSTAIGGLIGLYGKRGNYSFLSAALGFSAGVMIYVSMIELFPAALTSITKQFGEREGYIFTTIAFFAGIALIALIDRFIPKEDNPHEIQNLKSASDETAKAHMGKSALIRAGLLSSLAIAIHNFPEGLATFVGALHNPQLGVSIAIAIAIHNIPEGIAVSVPIYFATGNKKRAFAYSFVSGLAEPAGALVGCLFLMQVFTDAAFGIVFAAVAGIMVYISIDELLPTAEKYGRHHVTIAGVIAGMAVMALSLILF